MFHTTDSLAFRLRGLRGGEHPFAIAVTSADMGIEEAIEPIRVVGTLEASSSFVFKTTVFATLHHTCDRCAEEFDAKYVIPLTVIYTPGQEGDEIEDREYVHAFQEPELFEVDLTEDVHDALLLAVPMKKLCSEDCKGIEGLTVTTPVFDERFSALGSLYQKLRSEEDPE